MLLAQTTAAVALGDDPVHVRLKPAESTIQANRRALLKADSIQLIFSGLAADTQPGTLYRVFAGLPEKVAPDSKHYLATINFFNVVNLAGGVKKPDQPLIFDITPLIRKIAKFDRSGNYLALTFIPEQKPAAGSSPVIGEIRLYGIDQK